MSLILALLIGVIAGLRTMTAPAAVSWAAHLGWINLGASWLAFMGHWIAVAAFTILAVGELVADQLPSTPSRTVPVQFSGRIVMGALAGSALSVAGGGSVFAGLLAGVVGAIIGTFGGRAARGALARSFGRDRPAAFIEDAVAIVGAFLIVAAV